MELFSDHLRPLLSKVPLDFFPDVEMLLPPDEENISAESKRYDQGRAECHNTSIILPISGLKCLLMTSKF